MNINNLKKKILEEKLQEGEGASVPGGCSSGETEGTGVLLPAHGDAGASVRSSKVRKTSLLVKPAVGQFDVSHAGEQAKVPGRRVNEESN